MKFNNLENLGVFKDFTDGTIKSVFRTKERKIIEISLLMNKDSMDVVCVPTHHFCNLGCRMCHLTNSKLNKTMCTIKKDDFIESLIRGVCLQNINEGEFEKNRRTNKDKLLISFMGVGEPLLNQKLIVDIFNESDNLKKLLGYKEISFAISTMVPNLDLLKQFIRTVNINNIPIKIHFSLHTPIDEKRMELIPSTNVIIEEVLKELNYYCLLCRENKKIMDNYLKFHRNNITAEIHYTLMNEVNDSLEELEKIADLLQRHIIPIKFIKFNPLNDLAVSRIENHWYNTLKEKLCDYQVKRYSPPGREVGSSCGEFTKHYYHEEIETVEQFKEFVEWEKKHKIDY